MICESASAGLPHHKGACTGFSQCPDRWSLRGTWLWIWRGLPFEPLQGTVALKFVSPKAALLLALALSKRISDIHAPLVHPLCAQFILGDTRMSLKPNPAFVPKVMVHGPPLTSQHLLLLWWSSTLSCCARCGRHALMWRGLGASERAITCLSPGPVLTGVYLL